MADDIGGPPQPKAILRGHNAQIHVARFIRNNERLVTGDAEGFMVVWDLTIMRPRAVWRAHQKTILSVEEWGPERLITYVSGPNLHGDTLSCVLYPWMRADDCFPRSHGRDNELTVWKFGAADEARLSQALPLDGVPDTRLKPWIQHILPVNAMNFCAFAMASCSAELSVAESNEILVSTPNAMHVEGVRSLACNRPSHQLTP